MQHQLLLDYEFVTTQDGYVVRALLQLVGQTTTSASRVPLNLALVLDRSGSMGGEKLEAARDAAAFLVRRLAPDDLVSIVTYDDGVHTLVQPGDGRSRTGLAQAINTIEPGGSTNLSGGWLRGRELVVAGRREPGMNRVLLLTDGLANVGIRDPQQLTSLCANARTNGVSTSTIGFGADYDEALLRAMADAGGGNAYYIETPDQAPGVFEEEIEGLLSLAAQNMAVEVRPSAAVRLTALLHDYPSSAVAGGRRVELGDIYAREPKSLALEFLVPALADTAEVMIAEIIIEAHVLTADGGVMRQVVQVPVRTPLSRAGHNEPVVKQEVLLAQAARVREESLRRRNHGDTDGAGSVLRAMARDLRGVAEGNPLLEEQVNDLNAMAERMELKMFDAADAKYVAQRAYNAHRGKRLYEKKLERKPR